VPCEEPPAKLTTAQPMRSDSNYLAIRDYAVIGDGHTAALVGSNGSIDWCCCPQFDSPAVFCRLLDASRGGWCRIGPATPASITREYVPSTNILETTFQTEHAEWRITDFMPVQGGAANDKHDEASHRILRLVQGLRGDASCVVEFRPTFDYARAPTEIEITPLGAHAHKAHECMHLRSPVPLQLDERGAAIARWSVHAGDRTWFELRYASAAAASSQPDFEAALQSTLAYWRSWSARCTYDGPYHPLVRRSALALKLLTFEPTGAIIAAPTTSLPEELGGVRNWDYRYTWLRDSSLTLYALQSIGYHEEADAFFKWLEQLCLCCSGRPQIMYSIEAGTDLTELTLDHLAGYRNSRPVRIGNAAFRQKQLDIYGEVLDAAHLHVEWMKHPLVSKTWGVFTRFADAAATRWREPDQGIWEVRGGPRHFLYSKLMCWVALDRAVKISETLALLANTERWRATREEIRAEILCRGYNDELGAFTQSLDGSVLDASALAVPMTGFLPATDPRVLSTMDRIQEQLTRNGLVHRYWPSETDDGVAGSEAAFALCSFWLVDNLALTGRIAEAREMFERIVGYANDVGLLAEEIEPHSGDLLGNFPQGFTHLALIRAALSIAKTERRGGPERTAATPAERALDAPVGQLRQYR
jgi:GH15 family glucan-1,4-alpha-glucosidase